VPFGTRRYLERKSGSRYETTSWIIGKEFDLDRTLEPMSLGESADAKLCLRRLF